MIRTNMQTLVLCNIFLNTLQKIIHMDFYYYFTIITSGPGLIKVEAEQNEQGWTSTRTRNGRASLQVWGWLWSMQGYKVRLASKGVRPDGVLEILWILNMCPAVVDFEKDFLCFET